MRNRVIYCIRKLLLSSDGNVGVIFALALLPFLAGVGVAIDYSRAASMQARMQQIADAAALEGAISSESAEGERLQRIGGVIRSNWTQKYGSVAPPAWIAELAGTQVRVNLDRKLPTVMLGLIGVEAIDLRATSVADGSSGRGMELAIVVDVSGSMTRDIPDLRASLTDFLQIIYGDRQEAENIWISIIPF